MHRRHRLEFSYTGLNGAQNVLGALQSKYVFNYPRHTGLATWQAALGKAFVARSRVGALERLGRSPYAVWDVFGSWQKGHLQPYLQLSNLTAANYQEVIGVPMPGRGIVGGVELVWVKR